MFEIYRKVTSCIAIVLVGVLYGCGGSESSPNLAIAIAVLNSAPIASCPSDGITIQSGIDANGDQVLNGLEASNEQFICNGVNGALSLSPLISVVVEPNGQNCVSGGRQINIGLDTNRKNILDPLEITSVSYVCNGFVGSNGANGVTGVAGATGSNGIAGTNGSNGVNGSDGANGSNGSDGARGSIGITGDNGNDGHNSLVSIATIIGDANCPNGGLKINYGLDINNDSILNPGEMSAAKYTCNGTNGTDAPVAIVAYAYLYDLYDQTVEQTRGIIFEGTSDIHLGITHEGADILFDNLGVYSVAFSISPTSACQFALKLGEDILSHTVQGFDAGSQQNSGQMIIKIVNQRAPLQIINYGDAPVTLQIKADRELINASLKIIRIADLPRD